MDNFAQRAVNTMNPWFENNEIGKAFQEVSNSMAKMNLMFESLETIKRHNELLSTWHYENMHNLCIEEKNPSIGPWQKEDLQNNILDSVFYMDHLADCSAFPSQIADMIFPGLELNKESSLEAVFNAIGLLKVSDFKTHGIHDKTTLEKFLKENRDDLVGMLTRASLLDLITVGYK